MLAGGACIWLEVIINDWYRMFYDALVARNASAAVDAIVVFVGASAGLSLLTAGNSYFGELLDAELRNAMSVVLFRRATSHATAEQLKHAFPDQRIGEDIEIFTSRFAIVGITAVLMGLKGLVFFAILWDLSPPLLFMNVHVPGVLSMAAALYFLLPAAVTYLLGMKAYLYENRRRRAEARLRYSLIEALRDGEKKALAKYRRVLNQILIITKVGLRLNASSTLVSFGFSAMSVLVPMGMLLPFYFAEQVAFGDIIKASAAFSVFQASLSYVFTSSREVVRCIAALRRVEGFAGTLTANTAAQNCGQH